MNNDDNKVRFLRPNKARRRLALEYLVRNIHLEVEQSNPRKLN